MHSKRETTKKYNDLISIMQNLWKYGWLEGGSFSQKIVNCKFSIVKFLYHIAKTLTYNVIWFIICGNYFQREAFAQRNLKEAIRQKLDKVSSYIPEVNERITKADIKAETIQRTIMTDKDSVFLGDFQKAV